MSFSAGVYTLPGAALSTGDTVSATDHNQVRNDMATAFNLTWLRNGTATATANLPMGGFKLTGLGVATTSGDALSYAQAASVSDLAYTGTLTGGTGIVNLGSGQFYKDASGNVGVGTSSPSSKLQVAGDVRINTVGTATTGLPIYAKQTNNDQRGIWTESATTDSNGRFYCDNSVVGIAASYSSTGSYLPITFTTSATERARIDSSGNLLVGTTSNVAAPARSVAIGTSTYGALAAEAPGSGSGYPVWLRDTDATSASQQIVHFRRGPSNVGSITTTNTATAYNTSSDYRLKDQVQPMTSSLSVVQQLKPCTYKWKADGSDGQGFIAHELAEVVPDCVTGEKDAVDADGNPQYQGIDTSFLVATLTAAIQEQQAQISSQAAVITSLTERITALEAK